MNIRLWLLASCFIPFNSFAMEWGSAALEHLWDMSSSNGAEYPPIPQTVQRLGLPRCTRDANNDRITCTGYHVKKSGTMSSSCNWRGRYACYWHSEAAGILNSLYLTATNGEQFHIVRNKSKTGIGDFSYTATGCTFNGTNSRGQEVCADDSTWDNDRQITYSSEFNMTITINNASKYKFLDGVRIDSCLELYQVGTSGFANHFWVADHTGVNGNHHGEGLAYALDDAQCIGETFIPMRPATCIVENNGYGSRTIDLDHGTIPPVTSPTNAVSAQLKLLCDQAQAPNLVWSGDSDANTDLAMCTNGGTESNLSAAITGTGRNYILQVQSILNNGDPSKAPCYGSIKGSTVLTISYV
ncbi:hypothetical protein [Lelliottia sp. WAP21]|uniref:hypothetical protein n=1 Tax=Lelliottia sp. WAP21 TaxID=2877426 RepID=UPI001E57D503|nr:hypothetical protein [Lelliottia sp. WAP21]